MTIIGAGAGLPESQGGHLGSRQRPHSPRLPLRRRPPRHPIATGPALDPDPRAFWDDATLSGLVRSLDPLTIATAFIACAPEWVSLRLVLRRVSTAPDDKGGSISLKRSPLRGVQPLDGRRIVVHDCGGSSGSRSSRPRRSALR